METGDQTGVKSVVDTEYDACACSPLGKVKRVSRPYAPGQTPVWTSVSVRPTTWLTADVGYWWELAQAAGVSPATRRTEALANPSSTAAR